MPFGEWRTRSIDIPFNWSDTRPILDWTNVAGSGWTFVGARVIQGGTAGSVTAGVVTLKTPNCEYTITGPATWPVNGVAGVDGLGSDTVPIGTTLLGVVTTASGGAKEATLRLYLGGEGYGN